MNQPQVFKTAQSKPFAEVIQSSLDHFKAQSWQWDYFPRFGSLVQVQSDDATLFGCVASIQTGSMDPMRSPFPYQKTEEQLRAEQPQIFEFLQTTFHVQILGYNPPGPSFLYHIPPKPCKIHAFVQESSEQTAISFLQNPDFMHLLFAFQNQLGNLDELLLAILQQLASSGKLTPKNLNNFCQQFSLLNGNNYRRLKLFLSRVQHLLPS